MHCDRCSKQGLLYLFDELKEVERKEFSHHLQMCVYCQQELKLLRQTLQIYEAIPEEEPDAVSVQNVLNLVQPEELRSAFSLKRTWETVITLFPPRIRWAVVSVALLVILFFTIKYFAPSPEQKNQNIQKDWLLSWQSGLEDSLETLGSIISEWQINRYDFLPTFPSEERDYTFSWMSPTEMKIRLIRDEIEILSKELSESHF